MKITCDKEELEKLIFEDCFSYEKIGRFFECSGAAIKKRARKMGIELQPKRRINSSETFNKGKSKFTLCECKICGKKFKKTSVYATGKYCSLECSRKGKKIDVLESWLKGESLGCDKRYKLSPIIKDYILNLKGCQCEICHKNYINPYTNKTVLQIHHIDGNAENTKIENLQVLCPTHHAMTENFGSRNKNSIRRDYRHQDYIKQESCLNVNNC